MGMSLGPVSGSVDDMAAAVRRLAAALAAPLGYMCGSATLRGLATRFSNRR